jgi:hypothetical protein
MKKYIHNMHNGTFGPEEDISVTYQMWPVMYDLEVTRWRVVRFEDNKVKYERIFDNEDQAKIYIKENESI